VSQITSYDALSQELNLAYEKAIQRFPDRTDDIDDVFEAADEVYKSLRLIDKLIDEMDSKWAAETGQKFMWLKQERR
jgi:Ni,Fe-hydrogenase III large subunit